MHLWFLLRFFFFLQEDTRVWSSVSVLLLPSYMSCRNCVQLQKTHICVDHRAIECSSCGRCVPPSHGIAVLSPPENTDSYCCAAGASTQLYRFLCANRENDVFYWWCGSNSGAEGAENSLVMHVSPLLFREDCSLWKKLFSAAELLRPTIGRAASVAEERGTRVTIEYEQYW